MSNKPIYVATHPRSCSTAFERVFMTRSDLDCMHEPCGDAFYYGPERLGARYEIDEKAREESGFSRTTYRTVFDSIESEAAEGKRLFIKDIIHYLVPPEGKPASIAPSLQRLKRGIGTASSYLTNGVTSHEVNGQSKAPYPYATEAEPGNPTVVPFELLAKFHFTFLIRDPHSSIPSYYRCTVPPLDEVTGFYDFYPSEAGYDETRRVLDYLRKVGLVGDPPHQETTGKVDEDGSKAAAPAAELCVVDADDLLDDPVGIIQAYCKSVGLKYDPAMLTWAGEKHHQKAEIAFEKWRGFHNDAIESTGLKPRTHAKKVRTEAEWDAEWVAKFGEGPAKLIRDTVDKNMEDYLYLKQFSLRSEVPN